MKPKILENLITINDLKTNDPENILEKICLNIYEQANYHLREPEVFASLPVVLRDIILIIDFDTELNMNGILGFLENSTGIYLDETIFALERIGANNDSRVLKKIDQILKNHQTNVKKLRSDMENMEHYSITSFSKIHNGKFDEMYKEIANVAGNLYLNNNQNIFDYVQRYLYENKDNLIKEMI